MASEFLDIPGNIKQMYLPFVLNPKNGLHNTKITYADAGANADRQASGLDNASTQFFSYCKMQKGNIGTIHIAPQSVYDTALDANKDISYELLYSGQNQYEQRRVTIQTLLDSIPSIQIREYLQDAKLNMVFDLFQQFGNGWTDGTTSGEKSKEENENSKQPLSAVLSGIGLRVWNFIKTVTRDFGDIMLEATSDQINNVATFYINSKDNSPHTKSVLNFPYMLYYRLMSTTTTNIYEVPYNGQIMYESQGGGFSKGGLGGLTTDGKSIFGQFVNWFGKNIRINTTPTWDGPQDTPTKVEIDFSLYNDTIDAAIMNFIFVNTIVPNNKWIQYGIFQHAPCLYDVKINGINRLFMCQGDFKVESKGVLRKPSWTLINQLVNSHLNPRSSLTDLALLTNDLIRIPDIYDVHLTFTSLLPNNFNNFLFANYANQTIETLVGTDIYQESFLNPIANNLGNILSVYWEKAKNKANETEIKPTFATSKEKSELLDKSMNEGKEEMLKGTER